MPLSFWAKALLALAFWSGLGLLFALAVETLRYGAEAAFTGGNPEPAFAFFLRGAYWDILIVGLYIAWDLAAEAQQRQLREAQLESHLAGAHLRTLRAQLRPHFLFNTLNTISAYTADPRVARRMMVHLGALDRVRVEAGQVLHEGVGRDVREPAVHQDLHAPLPDQ